MSKAFIYEYEICEKLSDGLCRKEIAFDIGVTQEKLSYYIREIRDKYEASNSAHLVSKYLKQKHKIENHAE